MIIFVFIIAAVVLYGIKPAGMAFSLLRPQLRKAVTKNDCKNKRPLPEHRRITVFN